MKAKMIIMAIILAMAFLIPAEAQAQEYGLQNWTITFFDQEGDVFVDATTVTIYDVGTSDASTVYTTSTKTATVTNPIVSTDDLADGTITFWGAAPYYDIQIASSTYAGVIKRSYVRPTKHKIIYPLAESVGNVSAGTITATGAVSFEGNVILGNAVTDNITVTGAIQGANAIYFDGATDNTIETILAFADPCTSDKTITFQAVTGTVPIDVSGLITMPTNSGTISNATDGAWILGETSEDLKFAFTSNTVTLSSSTLLDTIDFGTLKTTFGGAPTVNAAASFTDNVTLGNAVTDITTMTGKIAGATPLTFDGTTANTVYTILAVADPTSASKTVTLPDATGTVMLSTLATNAPDVANSVTGASNQLIFEGSGVDAHEAIITATNPTADTVWTLPDAGAMTVAFMSSTLATNMPQVSDSIWGGTNSIYFEGNTADAYETILTCTQAASSSKTITLPNVTGTVLLDTSAIRTGQQYVQTIGYCKVGTTAGWVVPAAADAAHLATLPQSQTTATLIIPITIPLKVGWTITAWTINGQMDSGGNAVVLNAKLYKHTEATAGFANAAIGSGMAQLSKTGDYKVVDGEASLTEVVAADESFYLLVTGTTAATTTIEIAGITVTVSEL